MLSYSLNVIFDLKHIYGHWDAAMHGFTNSFGLFVLYNLCKQWANELDNLQQFDDTIEEH